jgi:hypothetical protein
MEQAFYDVVQSWVRHEAQRKSKKNECHAYCTRPTPPSADSFFNGVAVVCLPLFIDNLVAQCSLERLHGGG